MAIRNSRRAARRVLALSLLLALGLFANQAGRLLVVSRPPQAPDAIVSLASHERERLPATIAAARAYPSAAVLLTRPEIITDQNCYRCAERQAILIEAGIEPERIRLLPDPVSGTYDEAAASLAYARRTGAGEFLIVTSPYHARRALATFRRVFSGTAVALAIRPALAESPARPQRWWLHRYDRRYIAYEWAAMAYYALRFGVSPWTG